MTAAAYVCLLLACLWFAARRGLTYLQYFQQDEYDGSRFLRWLASSRSIDIKLSLGLAVLAIVQMLPLAAIPAWTFPLLGAVAFCIAAWREKDPRKHGKKKLVLTQRARRVLIVAAVLFTAATVAAAFFTAPLWCWLLLVQAIPFALVLANLALSPVEARIQLGFWNEAHQKLAGLDPMVIGITGSFGKTSTKHILGHVLSSFAPTLITPGSVNTPMGVSRIVREQLAARHKFFVVEMGAYGRGSIARLCRLTPPRLGVITAIGEAHYERYRSLEAVAEAKFELAEAVERRGGKMILNAELLAFARAAQFTSGYRGNVVLCGTSADADVRITELTQDGRGLSLKLTWQQQPYELRIPLFGLHHGRNAAVAFAAACTLGMPPDDVVLVMSRTPQIEHRLEVKPYRNGATLIDDAYNSNPSGFEAALEVLQILRPQGGRTILVTPGILELGSLHEQTHEMLGKRAANGLDVLLAVAPARIETFITSFSTHAPKAVVVRCASFEAADQWLAANVQANDVVLMENDLPDLYERKLRL